MSNNTSSVFNTAVPVKSGRVPRGLAFETWDPRNRPRVEIPFLFFSVVRTFPGMSFKIAA
jgi:hypothetical protein